MRRLTVLLAFLIACGGDSTSPNSDDISGNYTLRTVNGSALPFSIQSGTTTLTVLSDALTVGSNGTWSEVTSYRQTVNGQTTTGTGTDGGTWVRAGSQVSLHSSAGSAGDYNGTYSSGTLTLTNAGLVNVFSR